MVGKFARPRTVENLPHLVSLLISNTDQHQVRRRCTLQLNEELLLVISTTKQAPFWMFLFLGMYVIYVTLYVPMPKCLFVPIQERDGVRSMSMSMLSIIVRPLSGA